MQLDDDDRDTTKQIRLLREQLQSSSLDVTFENSDLVYLDAKSIQPNGGNLL